MVTLSAFLLVVTSEAANSLLHWSKDIKFSQVLTDTQQPPGGETQIDSLSGGQATG